MSDRRSEVIGMVTDLEGEDGDPVFLSPTDLELLTASDIPQEARIAVGVEKDGAQHIDWEGQLGVESGQIVAHGQYVIPRKYWGAALGLSHYMDLVRRAVEVRARDVGDIVLEDFEDDDWVRLAYRLEIKDEQNLRAAYERVRETQGHLEEAAQHITDEVGQMVSAFAQRLSGWGDAPLDKLVDAVETAKATAVKGRALEELMARLFASIPGFVITDRVRTETEEIDLVILNDNKDARFTREEALLLAECKNWTSKCGKNEFVIFKQKIENRSHRSSLGFLISWNGFAETVTKEMLRGSRERTLIVPITGEQVRRAVRKNSFPEELHAAWQSAVQI